MNKDNLFSKTFLLLFISNFFIFIGFEMIIPILPAHLASLEASTLQIGLVTSLFSLGAVIILFNEWAKKNACAICKYCVTHHHTYLPNS